MSPATSTPFMRTSESNSREFAEFPRNITARATPASLDRQTHLWLFAISGVGLRVIVPFSELEAGRQNKPLELRSATLIN